MRFLRRLAAAFTVGVVALLFVPISAASSDENPGVTFDRDCEQVTFYFTNLLPSEPPENYSANVYYGEGEEMRWAFSVLVSAPSDEQHSLPLPDPGVPFTFTVFLYGVADPIVHTFAPVDGCDPVPAPTVVSAVRTCGAITIALENLQSEPPEGWSARVYVEGALEYEITNRTGSELADFSYPESPVSLQYTVEFYGGSPVTGTLPPVTGCNVRISAHHDCAGQHIAVIDLVVGQTIRIMRNGDVKEEFIADDDEVVEGEVVEYRFYPEDPDDSNEYKVFVDDELLSEWTTEPVWSCEVEITRDCDSVDFVFPNVPSGGELFVIINRDGKFLDELIVDSRDPYRYSEDKTTSHTYKVFNPDGTIAEVTLSAPTDCDPPTTPPTTPPTPPDPDPTTTDPSETTTDSDDPPGEGGGWLPTTGMSLGAVGIWGVVILAAGVVAMLIARRKLLKP